ncbi:MAG TPA: hypothetical protein VI751_04775 [Actinomycetota bacterium]
MPVAGCGRHPGRAPAAQPGAVDAWASGHGLTVLPAGQREPAERYLRRSRLFRTVGGAVPFVTGTVPYALWAATRGLPAPWPRWPWSRWYR